MIFIYCKLCGEHLYKKLSFENLFKFHYHIHIECEKRLIITSDFVTIPLPNKLLLIDYLFEGNYEKADEDYLFTKYFHHLLKKALDNKEWSILLFNDVFVTEDDWMTLFQLSEGNILVLQIFYENIMKT